MLALLTGGVLACALAGLAAPAAQAAVDVNDVSIGEGGTVATFTVSRSAGLLTGNATISFSTSDGTAHAPGDYSATSSSLFFGSLPLGGYQEQTVSIPITADALDEPSETFDLVLSGSAEIGDGTGTATIVDDDPAPVVSVGNAPAASEAANATFTIALNTPSGRSVSVGYATANGSAIAGSDYTARSGTATIPAGAGATTVSVPLIDDGEDEPSESFELRISSPSNATLGTAAASATILDNDEPPAPPASPPDPGSAASSGAGATATPPLSPQAVGPPAATTGSGKSTVAQFGMSSPRLRRPSTVLVTVSCPRAASRCSGQVTIFSRASLRSKIKVLRKERRLGRGTFKLAAGATRTLQIKLSKTDRVLLIRAGRLNVRAFAVTEDAAGKSAVRRTTGTLIARTTHS